MRPTTSESISLDIWKENKFDEFGVINGTLVENQLRPIGKTSEQVAVKGRKMPKKAHCKRLEAKRPRNRKEEGTTPTKCELTPVQNEQEI